MIVVPTPASVVKDEGTGAIKLMDSSRIDMSRGHGYCDNKDIKEKNNKDEYMRACQWKQIPIELLYRSGNEEYSAMLDQWTRDGQVCFSYIPSILRLP
jgi:hypothetical protein